MRWPTTISVAICFLLALACSTTTSPAQQPIPKNDGWVTDLGGLLTPQQESSLEAFMESYEKTPFEKGKSPSPHRSPWLIMNVSNKIMANV